MGSGEAVNFVYPTLSGMQVRPLPGELKENAHEEGKKEVDTSGA